MERLRGKVKDVVKVEVAPAPVRKYKKLPKANAPVKSRSLDNIVREFKASAGNFEEFHLSLNGREKIIFKGYIEAMRKNEV